MSSDRSAAGKRFQKWLFHEVIPSLTKHGVYPPPPEAKGSVLAQMAEILAQIREHLLTQSINTKNWQKMSHRLKVRLPTLKAAWNC
ncbi:hypothetical protein OIU89_08550 [Escherichia coli]|nr:hypothetical protein [Escherichia coli]